MPRTRAIKPEFFTDEHISELPFEARLLFIGLWGIVDREGRAEYKPKRIKLQVLPYDDVDIESLFRLLSGKFITMYSVDGRNYFEVNNFHRHQKCNRKEMESIIPPNPSKMEHVQNGNGSGEEHNQNGHKTVAEQSQNIASPPVTVTVSVTDINNPLSPKGDAPEENSSEENNPEPHHRDPTSPEFRAAWKALDRWSEVATRYPLRLGVNLERDVWLLLEALRDQPPIIHGGKQTPQAMLIPLAVDSLIARKSQFKAGTSLKYITRSVQNLLDFWAKQGFPEAPKSAKSYDVEKGMGSERRANAALQKRLQEANWDPTKPLPISEKR